MAQADLQAVSPLEEARAIFNQETHWCSWEQWLEFFKLPQCVYVNDPIRGIVILAMPQISPDGDKPDTWFVWYASGPIKDMFAYMPYPLPYLLWERHKTKSLHFSRLERIRRLTMKGVK